MDSPTPATGATGTDAAEFVRFCYHRRRVGWPDLYDEMCAVGSRGLFRGWGVTELAEHGIGFSLFATPALASLVAQVVAEEQAAEPRRAGFSIARLGTGGRRGQDPRPELDQEDDAQPRATPALVPVPAR
ncbi:MAG TPA: hypothetical protein VFS32_02215 [Candidatus Limnocylindrales bacterium]|nr:hypothetical protein [Candidatus Limnocylindrales bacterium]